MTDRLARAAAGRAGLVMFSLALLTSASLLFSVQPLFAKMVLPYLGGSPSVWAVAMCFFQAALLAGYCYAHALNRFVPSLAAPIIHLAVCAIAVFTLPFALPEWAVEVPSGSSYLWLLSVLAVGVGLPFFAASANAPLLQAWFARSGHPHANDPYFLYGASNLGSLVSLLSYPFLIEPMLGVDTQRTVWAVGFGLLMVMIALCAVLMISNRAPALHVENARKAETKPVTLHDRLGWISLALIPSALLVAFTTHITTDVASAPFLWVIPLATFLGTFVIVFRDRSLIPHQWVLRLHPILVAAALVTLVLPHIGGTVVQGVLGFATFVVTTLVCHRALYNVRPASEKLTEFYLYMSLGGVLGGMFAALAAPQIFNTVAEYPLLIVAGLFARPGMMAAVRTLQWGTLTPIQWGLAIGPIAFVGFAQATGLGTGSLVVTLMTFVAILVAAALVLLSWRKDWLAIAGVVAVLLTMNAASLDGDGINVRSFFGVSRVIETADGRYRLLVHGSTTHGGQKLLDEKGKPLEKPHPVLYYHAQSPMVRGFEIARTTKTEGALNVGVVGLGTGALACSLEAGETISYFEIDPVVVDIARNPKHFTFLSACAPSSRVVLGDARLTIGKEPAAAFDYLVIDAFSSDAVPVHLLTREALSLYLSKVSKDGLLAFHISNRHMELESVVAATVATLPGVHVAAVLRETEERSFDDHPSHVMYVSRSLDVIARAKKIASARDVRAHETAPWSDNYADILSAIWRHYAN